MMIESETHRGFLKTLFLLGLPNDDWRGLVQRRALVTLERNSFWFIVRTKRYYMRSGRTNVIAYYVLDMGPQLKLLEFNDFTDRISVYILLIIIKDITLYIH